MKQAWLVLIAAALIPLGAMAAEGSHGATAKPDGKGTGVTAEQRRAQFEKRCAANPERCKEMKEKFAKRMEQCKANPDKCRAERQAKFDERFKKADADGNGAISRAEADKAMPRLARHFERIDANKDGLITRDEMAAARKAHFEQRKRAKPDPSKI